MMVAVLTTVHDNDDNGGSADDGGGADDGARRRQRRRRERRCLVGIVGSLSLSRSIGSDTNAGGGADDGTRRQRQRWQCGRWRATMMTVAERTTVSCWHRWLSLVLTMHVNDGSGENNGVTAALLALFCWIDGDGDSNDGAQ
jgi:hypothetical protein